MATARSRPLPIGLCAGDHACSETRSEKAVRGRPLLASRRHWSRHGPGVPARTFCVTVCWRSFT
jgi:hypothetical protein